MKNSLSFFLFFAFIITHAYEGAAQTNSVYGSPLIVTSRTNDTTSVYLKLATKNINGLMWNAGGGKLAFRVPQDSLIVSNDSVFYQNVSGYKYFKYTISGLLTGGDTTIFQNVIDTTGQKWRQVIFAGQGNKLSSSNKFLYQDTAYKLSIGDANPANGGTNKLYVKGNTKITGVLKLGALTLPNVDGSNGQALITDGAGHVSFQTVSGGGAGGSGTVTSVSSGNLSPLFTTNVATNTTTPVLSFSASNTNQFTILGRKASGSGVYSFLTADSSLIPGLHSEGYYDGRYLINVNTLYNADDALTGNRNIDLAGHSLSFSSAGGNNLYFVPNDHFTVYGNGGDDQQYFDYVNHVYYQYAGDQSSFIQHNNDFAFSGGTFHIGNLAGNGSGLISIDNNGLVSFDAGTMQSIHDRGNLISGTNSHGDSFTTLIDADHFTTTDNQTTAYTDISAGDILAVSPSATCSLQPNVLTVFNANSSKTAYITAEGIIPPSYSTAERDGYLISPSFYAIIFNTDSNQFEYWNGSAWMALSGGGSPDFSYQSLVESGTSLTVDYSTKQNFYFTITSNDDIDFTNVVPGKTIYLKATIGGSGNYHITFPSNTVFADGIATGLQLNLSTAVGAKDKISVTYNDVEDVYEVELARNYH